MSIILGFCYAVATLFLFSFFKFPESAVNVKKRFKPTHLKKKIKVQTELWPDVVDDLASSIRAGLSLPQAMMNLAQSGPELIRPELSMAMARYQVTGDFIGALEILQNSMKDPVVDKFANALQIAYEVGGTDLGQLLRSLSEVIREDNKIRGEINARQSWTINGARLAIAAPWFTVLILSTRKSAASVYLSLSGLRLLCFCAVVSVLAYFAMVKLGQLPTTKRINA